MDLAEESNCSYFCNGDDNQPCGGYAYMTLFELSSSSSSDQTSSSASSKKSTTTAAAAATTKAATTTSTSPTSSAGTTPGTSATTTSPGSSSNSASSTSSFALSYVVSNTIPSLNNYTSMPSTFVAASASNAQSDGSAAGSRVSTKSTNALPVIAATATAMGFVAAPTLRDAKQGIMFGYTLSSSSSTSFTTSSSTILSAIFFSLILPLLIPL
ncbi:hypothetical protein M231_00730 [Tremella mesenterica]|uniref:WSC domain-containing protein n=1 Tax=Tremella mesenterica TaxID=5217 RepID=A0A4Q1BV41_TREME|nr:hypothetical protein M231_00730 [Tremella mesenterica]